MIAYRAETAMANVAREAMSRVDDARSLHNGIVFRSITENIETSTNNGRLIFNIFASLAEFERNLIRERTLAGLSSARARGKLGGRPNAKQAKIDAAIQLYNKRELTVDQICKAVSISRGTLYKYLNK